MGTQHFEEEPGTAIAPRKPTMLRPIAEPKMIIEAHKEMAALIKEALTEGKEPGTGDYGVVPGTNKKALWKPGAEKITNGMGCMFGEPQIIEREVDHDRTNRYTKRKKDWYGDGRNDFKWVEESGESYGLYRYVIRVPVINRATGEIVGYGIGSCSSMESKFIDRPRDVENTIYKIAKKRAVVDATLTTFGLSGEFQASTDDEHAGEDDSEGSGKAAVTLDPADVPAKCEGCGGTKFFDNRKKKASGEWKPNAADFRCQNRSCGKQVWVDAKKKAQPAAAAPAAPAAAAPQVDDEGRVQLPFK